MTVYFGVGFEFWLQIIWDLVFVSSYSVPVLNEETALKVGNLIQEQDFPVFSLLYPFWQLSVGLSPPYLKNFH